MKSNRIFQDGQKSPEFCSRGGQDNWNPSTSTPRPGQEVGTAECRRSVDPRVDWIVHPPTSDAFWGRKPFHRMGNLVLCTTRKVGRRSRIRTTFSALFLMRKMTLSLHFRHCRHFSLPARPKELDPLTIGFRVRRVLEGIKLRTDTISVPSLVGTLLPTRQGGSLLQKLQIGVRS